MPILPGSIDSRFSALCAGLSCNFRYPVRACACKRIGIVLERVTSGVFAIRVFAEQFLKFAFFPSSLIIRSFKQLTFH